MAQPAVSLLQPILLSGAGGALSVDLLDGNGGGWNTLDWRLVCCTLGCRILRPGRTRCGLLDPAGVGRIPHVHQYALKDVSHNRRNCARVDSPALHIPDWL